METTNNAVKPTLHCISSSAFQKQDRHVTCSGISLLSRGFPKTG